MSSAVIRLAKSRNGVPIPIIDLLANADLMEASFRRVIQETPVEHLYGGHGRLDPNVSLSQLPASWTMAEATQCRLLLNWAQPWRMTHSGKGVRFEPPPSISKLPQKPKPSPKPVMRRATQWATVTGGGVHPKTSVGPFQLSTQVCQALEPVSAQDLSVVQNAYDDAVQQLQIASAKLGAAQTDFLQLNLQQPNLQQLNLDLPQAGIALTRWQGDRDQALAAILDATQSAALCPANGVLSAAAAQAQTYAGYFTDPNILLQVATLNQAVQSLTQGILVALQQAPDLQSKTQSLFGQVSGCMSLYPQWWGAQLVLDEHCTGLMVDLLDKIILGVAIGAIGNIVSAPPPLYPLLLLWWTVLAAQPFLVEEDIKGADEKRKQGVTFNISWIPLGPGVLADIASAGTGIPTVTYAEELAEEATLVAELTNPGFGSQWYSFFWITGN